jgi:hypothetical protein
MTRRQEYHSDHLLAKTIIASITGTLIWLYMGEFSLLIMICNSLYFFGVNTVQYIIEKFRHHIHKVNKI